MNSEKKPKGKVLALKYLLYDFVKWTGAITALPFIRPSVRYTDKKAVCALKGGYIISSNHMGYLDPVILHCAFPWRRLFFIAVDALFNTPLKNWFFSHVNCIKINKKSASTDTIRAAGEVLRDGKIICIFPEGQINRESDSKTAAFRPGCAMIAALNNAPILPVYIGKRKSVWHCTRVLVGAPIYPDKVLGDNRSVFDMEKLNRYLFEKENELYERFTELQK